MILSWTMTAVRPSRSVRPAVGARGRGAQTLQGQHPPTQTAEAARHRLLTAESDWGPPGAKVTSLRA